MAKAIMQLTLYEATKCAKATATRLPIPSESSHFVQRNWTAARNYFWHKTCVCQKKAVILQRKIVLILTCDYEIQLSFVLQSCKTLRRTMA